MSLATVSPATSALASGFVFPLAGGTLNPSTGYGSLTTTGGITLSTSFGVPGLFSSGSEATISEPSLTLGSSSSLSFTSQEASPPRFPFATVSLKGVHPLVSGATITLTDLPVSLTATGVQFLGGFASGAFTPGEALGSITVQVTASS
ncbi:MAG: HtaA domain-containing protein [Solirubrobacteraceae bacterium]